MTLLVFTISACSWMPEVLQSQKSFGIYILSALNAINNISSVPNKYSESRETLIYYVVQEGYHERLNF